MRDWVKGSEDDAIHAALCGVGHNLRLIQAHLRVLILALIVLMRSARDSVTVQTGPEEVVGGHALGIQNSRTRGHR